MLTAIDLFAGAGGFSVAAGNLHIRVLAAVECEKHACCTYHANLVKDRGECAPLLVRRDINKLRPEVLMRRLGIQQGQCDILMGGPPCQGYSTHRLGDVGVGDERNELLIRYFDFVARMRPKTFVVENVTGLLWPRHASYLQEFLSLAAAAEYKTYGPTVLNACDYGVPQTRKRVFIVGVAPEIGKLPWPPPKTHFSPKSPEHIRLGKPAWRQASEVFDEPLPDNDPNSIHMNHSPRLTEVFRSTPKNGGSRSQSNRILPCHTNHTGHKDVYGRIDPSRPGPTMTTACVNPSKGRFVHPTEDHGICLRHAARFQTFDDGFVFSGGLMAGAVQVGNAVPVRLGEAVLGALAQALTGAAEMDGEYQLDLALEGDRVSVL